MNKFIIIGNLTKDPELTTTPSGTNVCKLNVAVNRKFVDANGNRGVDYFTVQAWRQLGENCAKFLTKGRKVAVSGEVQNRKYQAQDGTDKWITEVVANEIEFLSPKADGQQTSMNDPEAGMTPVDDDSLPF